MKAKVFENKQNTRFYSVLNDLPRILQEDPAQGKRLIDLYTLGKKKKIQGIALAVVLLLGASAVSDIMSLAPAVIPEGVAR